jgi:surfeit locus 1 family protein
MKLPGKRSRFWPTAATIIGVAVTLALGNWQLGRGAQKRELKARYETQAAQPPIHVGAEVLRAEDMDLRRAEARGVFEPQYTVFIDNRIHRGVPGYHVMMPLKIEGSDRYVLVNRGWVARPALRSELPALRTPNGVVAISGTAIVPKPAPFERMDRVAEGRIWQNLTVPRYAEANPIRVQPFVIRQDSALDDGLVRSWPAPDFGVEKHYGYAFQWFALAATLAGFYGYTQFRHQFKRRSRSEPPAQ